MKLLFKLIFSIFAIWSNSSFADNEVNLVSVCKSNDTLLEFVILEAGKVGQSCVQPSINGGYDVGQVIRLVDLKATPICETKITHTLCMPSKPIRPTKPTDCYCFTEVGPEQGSIIQNQPYLDVDLSRKLRANDTSLE